MITINWENKIIEVPISYLTLVQVSPVPIYDLPLNQFHLDLRTLEASEDGKAFIKTHKHNTEVNLGGIVYARIIEIVNGYTVTFEDSQYAVNLTGANSNVGDVVNVNQVSVRSQNSAGLISNQAIEFSSFNGGVTIDIFNKTGFAVAGTVFPTGTRQAPSNNLADAALIASRRGFSTIFVLGNATFDDTASWEGFEFIGESPLKSVISILPIANVLNCEFIDATVTGTLDGNSQLKLCTVNNLDFVDGQMSACSIGDITLGTSTQANIFTSFSTVAGSSTPEIDMNATGILALRDYNGGVLLKNYTGVGSHSIDLSSGQVKLASTITSGTFIVRGVGKLIDELGNHIHSGIWNGGVTIVNELLNLTTIPESVWDKTFADSVTPATFGWIMNDVLRNVGYDITSELSGLDTLISIWEDTGHTTLYRKFNIGTVESPQRIDITP